MSIRDAPNVKRRNKDDMSSWTDKNECNVLADLYGGPKGRAMRQYLSDSIYATIDNIHATIDDNSATVDNSYATND